MAYPNGSSCSGVRDVGVGVVGLAIDGIVDLDILIVGGICYTFLMVIILYFMGTLFTMHSRIHHCDTKNDIHLQASIILARCCIDGNVKYHCVLHYHSFFFFFLLLHLCARIIFI